MALASALDRVSRHRREAAYLALSAYDWFAASLASFFIGQAKVIPKPYRIMPLLLIPPLIVLGALIYWAWRVRFKRSFRGMVLLPASEGSRVRAS